MSLARLFRRRKPLPFAEWGWTVRNFDLPSDGRVQFAQWNHPATSVTEIEQSEVDALRQWIRPGDFAIDVGAHTGDTTVPIALAAGPTGRVLALEPNRYVHAVLAANAQLNASRTSIDARCFAATDVDGQFEFQYGDASFCNGGAPIGRWNPFRRKYPLAVDGRNLHALVRRDFAGWLPKLAYVKVDAEGHDLAILKSILPLLRDRLPVVRTEVFKKLPAADRRALYDVLSDAGYAIYRYGNAGSTGAGLTRGDMTAIRHFDVLALPLTARARRAA